MLIIVIVQMNGFSINVIGNNQEQELIMKLWADGTITVELQNKLLKSVWKIKNLINHLKLITLIKCLKYLIGKKTYK